MKLGLKILWVTPLIVILSCTSISKRDVRLDTENEMWLQDYARALQNKNCESMEKLAGQEKFFLRDLAVVRSIVFCEKPIFAEKLQTQNFSDFMQSAVVEARLSLAEKNKDNLALAKARLSQAMNSDRVKEKVILLQEALALASEDLALRGDLQQRLDQLAPRLKSDIKASDYQKVGADFIFNRQFKKGRDYLEKIFQSSWASFDEQYQARRLYRNSFKTEQNKDRYTQEAEKFAHWIEKKKMLDPRQLQEAYLAWIRAEWTQGQVGRARKTLLSAQKKIKSPLAQEEMQFLFGRMAEEAQDFQNALLEFQKGSSFSKETSPFREKLLFSQGWMLRKLNRFDEAAQVFSELRQKTQDPFDQFRYAFWFAQSLKSSGHPEEATAEFLKLQSEDSLGFYGLLTYRELGIEMPPLPVADSQSLDLRDLPSEEQVWIHSLLVARENDVLEKYLNSKTLKIRGPSSDAKAWLPYLKSYAAAGLYLPLFAQLGALEIKERGQLLKEHPELLFPRKYLDVIEPAALKFGVQSELILSIIRQESAFNPFARSPADAFGLMQVIPSVATDLESITGIQLKDHDDLFVPENNVPVGAALLQKLSKKYRGQFILTTAAYNANEKAINNWLKTRLRDDALEFIEDIPYDETRAYVKLVLRNFIFYSRLKSPQQKTVFPTWCLEDLQSFKVSTK